MATSSKRSREAAMDFLLRLPYDAAVRAALSSLERNLLPDAVVRRLTRILLAGRLRLGYQPSAELQLSHLLLFKRSLLDLPIAILTEKPKSQHYELPTFFFKLVLGKHLKYSCCYFLEKSSSLEDAEHAMLDLYSERAQLMDGQSVLDVGCGWGSLALFVACKFPDSHVTGICNSITQKEFIDEQCRERQLENVKIIVADISDFEMEDQFDRVISIEMFEHMKNYKELLKKISLWMKPDGLLFVHYFCHRTFAYHLEDNNEDDWITRYFFAGGTMPSANLLLYFQDDVCVLDHWLVSGTHYSRTSEEWLKRMDQNMASIRPIMESTYGKDSATKWTAYWRTFFISVSELFCYNSGEEWMVAHYLFNKRSVS